MARENKMRILRRVNFGAGSKFGAEVAKRYGEGSEMLVFLAKYYGFGRLQYGRVLWVFHELPPPPPPKTPIPPQNLPLQGTGFASSPCLSNGAGVWRFSVLLFRGLGFLLPFSKTMRPPIFEAQMCMPGQRGHRQIAHPFTVAVVHLTLAPPLNLHPSQTVANEAELWE